jgi:hypothetical protein
LGRHEVEIVEGGGRRGEEGRRDGDLRLKFEWKGGSRRPGAILV